ncbi:hypothetical protein ACU8V3_08545 [Cobetia marina]
MNQRHDVPTAESNAPARLAQSRDEGALDDQGLVLQDLSVLRGGIRCWTCRARCAHTVAS